MLLRLALFLFACWLAGVLLLKGSFIHVVLLTAITIAIVQIVHNYRCGKPLLQMK